MIKFEQGLDPYKTMEIGANRPIKVRDSFICIKENKPFVPGKEYQISMIVTSIKGKRYSLRTPGNMFSVSFTRDILEKYFRLV
jgi:hypothetical protein